MFWVTLFFLGSSLALIAAMIIFIYATAVTNRHATFVENGGFKFVVRGQSIHRILDNLHGHYVDQETKVIVRLESGKEKPESGNIFIDWLERSWGIFWVSIFWPLIKVHTFKIAADKIKPDSEIRPGDPLKNWVDIATRDEKYLRWRFPHPLSINDVELGGDRWRVNLLIVFDIEIVNPSIVVFNYKGTREVLTFVDAAVANAVITFFGNSKVMVNGEERDWDYGQFILANKGRGSSLEKVILDLNGPSMEADNTTVRQQGLEHRYGVKISSARVEAVNLSTQEQKLEEAATERRKQELLADAKKETARGDKTMAQALLEGRAEGLTSIARKLSEAGVGISGDQIGRIIFEEVRTGNLGGPNSKLTTYVEGGSNAIPTIPIDKTGDKENRQ